MRGLRRRRARGLVVAGIVVAALVAPPRQPVGTTPASLPTLATTTERNPTPQPTLERAARKRVIHSSGKLSTTTREPVDKSAIVKVILEAARHYGIDAARFLRVAKCESGLRPNAVSKSGRYVGMFQHDRVYWPARAARAGFKGASPFNARAAAFTSAWLIRHGGGWGHFPVCSR